MTVRVTLSNGILGFPTIAVVDCGATGGGFIHASFARIHGLKLTPHPVPCELSVIDSRSNSYGPVTDPASMSMNVGGR